MIKLEKGDEPEILSRRAGAWTERVMSKITTGATLTKSEKSRYNHVEIKGALLAETHEKCAYCESKFRHVTFGDVEHVVPKVDEPSMWFSWPNLTMACDVCNTNKGQTPVDERTFIDPYEVDPEDHFWQLGALIWARPGSDAATLTERLLGLNRADLVERRGERLARLRGMLETIERCANAELKELLWREFIAEGASHNEYAAMSRTVIELAERRLGMT